MNKEVKFGLLGRNISYSFSKKYFTEKFNKLRLDTHEYVNFDIPTIDMFPNVIHENEKVIRGINVTIPYKQDVFQYLDEVDKDAKTIGAVNTIKILDNLKLKGYNTDAFGFENSLKPLLKPHVKKALILGTGGASKAVAFVLSKLNIDYKFVSRSPKNKQTITYQDLDKYLMENHHLVINCSPLGTFPNVDLKPNIPYQYITNKHFLYDLIYNPELTAFLQEGKEVGATIKNGEDMLKFQADKAWEIWNS